MRYLQTLPLLAAALVLSACEGADDPLAPAPEPVATDITTSGEAPAALVSGQLLTFTSYRNGQADIYRMDPQGLNLLPLTTSASKETSPAWSYDNTRIALVRSRAYSGTLYDDIYLINRDGSNGHWARSTATGLSTTYPAWSPDGSRLVVAIGLNGGPYLATLDLATGQLAYVLNSAKYPIAGSKPSYDPTGKAITFVGPTGRTLDRVVPGNNPTHLVSSDTPIGRPAYSPDGKKIAYSRVLSGTSNTEIFVRNLADGATKRLTSSAGFDGEPTWSPDGGKIAFASKRTGQSQIYTMSATGGTPTRITHTSTQELTPAWTH